MAPYLRASCSDVRLAAITPTSELSVVRDAVTITRVAAGAEAAEIQVRGYAVKGDINVTQAETVVLMGIAYVLARIQ